MSIDLSIFTSYAPQFFLGFWMTIRIVLGAITLGMPFGLVLALCQRSRFKLLRILAVSYIEIFRNTPFIIQVFIFFYVLPFYGLHLPAAYVGTVALAAFGSAYLCCFATNAANCFTCIDQSDALASKRIGDLVDDNRRRTDDGGNYGSRSNISPI